jgi:hypothetical protein
MQIRDGGTLVLRTGSTQFVEANAVISAATGALMQGDWTFDASSIVRLLGRKTLRPRSLLSDANHLINTTEADCFELSKTVGGTINTIRLQTTTPPIPEPNERIELVWPVGTAGNKYQIEREDGTVICQFYGNAALNAVITATFDFDNGVWRLGANPGFDATDVTGVLAGPGA